MRRAGLLVVMFIVACDHTVAEGQVQETQAKTFRVMSQSDRREGQLTIGAGALAFGSDGGTSEVRVPLQQITLYVGGRGMAGDMLEVRADNLPIPMSFYQRGAHPGRDVTLASALAQALGDEAGTSNDRLWVRHIHGGRLPCLGVLLIGPNRVEYTSEISAHSFTLEGERARNLEIGWKGPTVVSVGPHQFEHQSLGGSALNPEALLRSLHEVIKPH